MRRWRWVVILFYLFITFTASAQEANDVSQPVLRADGVRAPSPEQVLSNQLQAYLAVANGDLSLCVDQLCISKATKYLNYRYVGEGRCEEIKKEFSKNICNMLKQSQCDSLDNQGQRESCKALISGDVTMVPQVVAAINDPESSVETAALVLGIVAGYKYKDIGACEKYVKNFIVDDSADFYVCKILFSSNPEEVVKQITSDLMLFNHAKDIGDTASCWSIKDRQLHQKCLLFRQPAEKP